MALFGKDREREVAAPVAAPQPAAAPVVPPPDAAREVEMFERERDTKARPDEPGGTTAFLGKGTRMTGKLTFEGTVRIEGEVDGEIAAQDTLIIGEAAAVKAKVTGTAIVVHGQVTGDIIAGTRLELRAPSRVVGNIRTPNLVIHEGASFEGQCAMGGAEGRRGKKEKPDFSALLRSGEGAEEDEPQHEATK